jgi:uncharacterized repeat protein (TIGR01451 family)/CSLREA domain-containing protein
MLALGAGFASATASAATFVVDSTVDGTDAVPGDGICATADSACTLRAAVMEANATAGADFIDLRSIDDPLNPIVLDIDGVDETYELTPGGAVACAAVIAADASQGDLDITDDVTIQGAGPGLTVIRWDEQSVTDPNVGDRIFHVQAPTGVTVNLVSIRDLMVTYGSVGIPNDTSVENPYNCEVTGEVGSLRATQFRRFGGGIAVGPGAAVVIFEETAHGGGGTGGSHRPPDVGGDEGEETGGVTAVELEGVAVVNNVSGSDAGGVISVAETTISKSAFSGNVSYANGGALYLDSPTTVSDTLIGASATDWPYVTVDGVPAGVPADLLVANVGENGGGIFATGSHTSYIESSAINGNEAIGGGAIAGRALVTLNLTNTTVSANTAEDVGGGITTNGTVNLRNATVTDNASASDAEGGGAGLNSFGDGTYIFVNTILSNNTVGAEAAVRDANCGCTGGESACPPGRMVSTGNNLTDEPVEADTCQLTLGTDVHADPLLEPLANNGGLTETQALVKDSGSPAIDGGDNTRCPNNDQRGVLRPDDGDLNGSYLCDIGAFELFIPRSDLHINNVTAPNEVDKGDQFDVVVEVHNDDANVTAPGVTLEAALDPAAGISIADAQWTDDTGTLPAQACTVDGPTATVTCDFGDLANTEIRVVTIAMTADAQGAYSLTSTVATTDPDIDLVPGNNTVVSQIAVIGNSDIQLTGGPVAANVDLGDDATFNFTVTNLGEDPATNVRFGLLLPPGVSLVSASSDAGPDCSESAGEVVCPIGAMMVDGTAAVEVLVTASDAGLASFDASAAADQNDPDLANNSVASDVAFVANADLGVTVTSSVDAVRAKKDFSVTIQVTNNGPQDATDVVATSTLPSSVSFVSATGCSIASGTLLCTAANLASGASESFTVNLTAVAKGETTITVAASADQQDPVSTNDTDSVTFTIKSSGGGGGCAYNPGGPIDLTLPGLLLVSLLALFRRQRAGG